MSSSSSDLTLFSDSDLTSSSYDDRTNKVTPIAIVLIFILLILLIGFFITNLSNTPSKQNFQKLETNYETKPETKPETKKSIYENVHPASIQKTLDKTTQELNNSINQLTNLLNNTTGENKNYGEEIKSLEKTIEDLKSEIVILQSKLIDSELKKTAVGHKIPTVNITADKPDVSYTYNNFQDDVIIYDPIANYDRLKLNDPLVDPRGRSSADQIPTPQVAAQLNFPTQGVIDRYHRVGLLIAVNHDSDEKYYSRNNSFDDFYGKQKPLNILETNADYSMSSSPTYNANTNRSYNGVQILDNSSSTTMSSENNNLSSISNSVFTSTSPSSITKISPKSSKSSKSSKSKKNKHKKNKNKKEHFLIEGFSNEDNYETFYSDDEDDEDIDYNGLIYNKPNKKYPYFDDYEFNDVDNFTSLENQSKEEFGNLDGNSRKNRKNSEHININNGDNNILELIGKKITDNWYKYFTSISVGNKIIKINVYNRNRRELYDGDIVFIPELGKRYRVQIDEMDMIEYNPYFF